MEKQERSALLKALGTAIKEYVSDAVRGLVAELEELKGSIAAIPMPARGEKGDRGEPGEAIQGPAGAPGERGPIGASAYDIACELGFRGAHPEWLASLRGRDGRDGERGADGTPGPGVDPHVIRTTVAQEVAKAIAALAPAKDGRPGAPGKDGESIHRDSVALMVVEEVRKAVAAMPPAVVPATIEMEAADPVPGPPGPAGSPGRDATQIDILPAADLSRSYPRGTFARHDGGLIRSFRDTIPGDGDSLERCGWEVVVAGISEFSVFESENPRTFRFWFRATGGQKCEHRFSMPVLLYRGVFRTGTEYQQGDVVTWDGSAWHCQVDQPKGAPGKSEGEWLLMVKRGTPGKDGAPGIPGAKGEKGDAGKDLTQLGPDGKKW